MTVLDPEIIRQQIAQLLLMYPELSEDDDARALSVESETDAYDYLALIVRQIEDAKALTSGTKERIEELSARKDRYGRRQEALRNLAQRIMEAAELSKAELPCATLSIRRVSPKLIVDDEEKLPDAACKFVRKPDMEKIKAIWESNEPISGVHLDNGGQSLTIRVK